MPDQRTRTELELAVQRRLEELIDCMIEDNESVCIGCIAGIEHRHPEPPQPWEIREAVTDLIELIDPTAAED